MKLSTREKAWLNRKASSHPTYDQWGKKAGTLEERMKKKLGIKSGTKNTGDLGMLLTSTKVRHLKQTLGLNNLK